MKVKPFLAVLISIFSVEAFARGFPTVEMRDGFLERDQKRGVIYCGQSEDPEKLCTRTVEQMIVREGKVFSAKGRILPDSQNKKDGVINYVMDSAGRLFLFDEKTNPEIRHSSIFAGGPVAGAGDIRIRGGTIDCIDSNSGHYDTASVFPNVLRVLARGGISDVPGCK